MESDCKVARHHRWRRTRMPDHDTGHSKSEHRQMRLRKPPKLSSKGTDCWAMKMNTLNWFLDLFMVQGGRVGGTLRKRTLPTAFYGSLPGAGWVGGWVTQKPTLPTAFYGSLHGAGWVGGWDTHKPTLPTAFYESLEFTLHRCASSFLSTRSLRIGGEKKEKTQNRGGRGVTATSWRECETSPMAPIS